jgi:hypothetical protein
MSGLVILFLVVRGGSSVRVCGEFMEFSSFFVRLMWHKVPYPNNRISLKSFPFPDCSILRTRAEQARACQPDAHNWGVILRQSEYLKS